MALSGAALDHREQRFHNRVEGVGFGILIDPLPLPIINGNRMPILPTFESLSVLYNSFGFPSRMVDVETEDHFMKFRIVTTLGLLALGFSATALEAQIFRPGFVPGYGYGGPAGYTPGMYRGFNEAAVIRAQGAAYKDATAGAINYEDARTKYIDNQLHYTNMYIQQQKALEQYREEKNEKAKAERMEWMRNREPREPETLSPSQLDPSQGAIKWPEPLMDPAYAMLRAKIEDEFKQRALTSASNTSAILDLTDQMLERLQTHVKEMRPSAYIAARKFIEGLANEVRGDY